MSSDTTNNDETLSDAQRIEHIITLIYEDLLAEGGRFKIMELLKALEFKRKIAPPDDREGAFWNMIDELRHEELKSTDRQQLKHSKAPKSKSKSKKPPLKGKSSKTL